jgi:uncharacterized protein
MQYTYSLVGGALIGLSASLVLFTHGRPAGISGIFAGLVHREADPLGFRWTFILGLCAAGLALRVLAPALFVAPGSTLEPQPSQGVLVSLGVLLGSGVLVGIGTQLGHGCTSGHGVCGVSRGSLRSVVATCVFIACGAVTVFVVRHISKVHW